MLELEIARDKFLKSDDDLLEYISNNIINLKKQFLSSDLSEDVSYLRLYSEVYGNETFFRTNCEITAFMLRYIFSGSVLNNWISNTDKGSVTMKEIYQISYGCEEYDVEHILTVYKKHILHSYFGKFEFEIMDSGDFDIESYSENGESIFYYYPSE